VEDAEVRFTDEGIGTLENGVARIDLDPMFMETIEGAYIVHVTPYGDAVLYVDGGSVPFARAMVMCGWRRLSSTTSDISDPIAAILIP